MDVTCLLLMEKELGIFGEEAKLTDRPPEIPAWDDSTPEQQQVYSRMMEVPWGSGRGRAGGRVEQLPLSPFYGHPIYLLPHASYGHLPIYPCKPPL